MNEFAPIDTSEVKEPVHTLTEEELDKLSKEYTRLRALVDSGNYELTIDDQKIILQWRRADRETKFILNKTKVKEKKESKTKVPKPKKPKKLTQKALSLIYMKELKKEPLTEEEEINRAFTLGIEYTPKEVVDENAE